ncbi:hypothetical protein BOX15_Mlig025327g1 [Macrostomum lignano]|uniref:Uncharacterized protein n=1 Tax=Macrostomum lignano TaxID=282301 RepID=A0A267FXC1_9PLAT|nr:hypothetical protein BOX15_Mlig025327g3 [Macrostomum lignano]PAA78383.1 hypothetical protein BOX15_Mlig025327g1 [Macrostomum lignano]
MGCCDFFRAKTILHLTGFLVCEIKPSTEADHLDSDSPPCGSGNANSSRSSGSQCSQLTPSTVKKLQAKRRMDETKETADLSNAELQRLLLLEKFT